MEFADVELCKMGNEYTDVDYAKICMKIECEKVRNGLEEIDNLYKKASSVFETDGDRSPKIKEIIDRLDYLKKALPESEFRIKWTLQRHQYPKELVDVVVSYFPNLCPKGEFIAYKKVMLGGKHWCGRRAIAELIIPEDAKRCSGFGRMCRCDKAIVKRILRMIAADNDYGDDAVGYSIYSMNNSKELFEYRVGEMVVADSFDENRFNEYSHGIHFFLTKEEAVDY